MRLILVAAACFLATAPAWAADCDSTSTQMAMSACAGATLQKDDATLNGLYGQIQRRLKTEPDTLKLFTASQRSWVVFRDAECNFSTSLSVGGTVHPMAVNLCVDGLTRKRIQDFRHYLMCDEGDMSCPVPSN